MKVYFVKNNAMLLYNADLNLHCYRALFGAIDNFGLVKGARTEQIKELIKMKAVIKKEVNRSIYCYYREELKDQYKTRFKCELDDPYCEVNWEFDDDELCRESYRMLLWCIGNLIPGRTIVPEIPVMNYGTARKVYKQLDGIIYKKKRKIHVNPKIIAARFENHLIIDDITREAFEL